MSEDNSLRLSIEPDTSLHVDADAGEAFKLPSYDIAPEDKHIASEILATDPLNFPSPFKGFEGIKAPELKLSALPTHLRKDVEAKLANLPADKRWENEQLLVQAAFEANSREVRSRAGVGEGALPIHQQLAELTADHRALGQRGQAITDQLAEVSHHDTQVDPATGQRVPVPVLAVQGQMRVGLERELEQVAYRMKLLEGPEGKRLMDKALAESVAIVKQRTAMLRDEAEVTALAEKQVREARLAKRAKVRARMIDPDVFTDA
jgi:hypothetical protein